MTVQLAAAVTALIVAWLMIRRRKWDKIALALILLASGALANAWHNPISHLNSNLLAGLSVVLLAWIVIDLQTKQIEKATYGAAFVFGFCALASGGIVGSIADAIYGNGLLTQALSQLT
jgi:apolipoprotein N-acyltransferase